MAETFLAGDFLAHAVIFGDFMARNFLAADFLGGYRFSPLVFFVCVLQSANR